VYRVLEATVADATLICTFYYYYYYYYACTSACTCRCTSLYGTPTMYIDMMNLADFEEIDLSSLFTGEH